MTFELKELSERQQADFKADGRMRAYLAMKKAFKKRASESGVTIQSLSEALGRDKGQISRVLSGRSAGVTLDTFVLIMSALGFRSSFDATPVEQAKPQRCSCELAKRHSVADGKPPRGKSLHCRSIADQHCWDLR